MRDISKHLAKLDLFRCRVSVRTYTATVLYTTQATQATQATLLHITATIAVQLSTIHSTATLRVNIYFCTNRTFRDLL